MIQRIQTIFLLLSSICMFLLAFVLPIWFGTNGVQKVSLMGMGMVLTENGENSQIANPMAISIIAFIAGSISLFSMLQYKNRLRQMKIGALNSLVIGLAFAACYYYINQGMDLLGDDYKAKYMVGFYMPIIALLMNLLANRFIRRDEKMVRASDRLR